MISSRAWTRTSIGALVTFVLGAIGCGIGAAIDTGGFCRAWLCAFLFWLGLPLGGVTLILVHDLTGGRWMATARPALNAATATMPLATLAGIPAFIGLGAIYSWAHPAPDLGNIFYLNSGAFLLRYAIDIVLWNLLAAFALWARRDEAAPIAPALSWLSGIGLILLALSASFASIDWILSLEPTFWSSVFPMIAGASWFNTGLAFVLLTIALVGVPIERLAHLADLAAILLAMTMFWAYVEFCQFLIVWEENLKGEIPWYLIRYHSVWKPALFVSIGLGFLVPFLVLLWAPLKRRRVAVAVVCMLVVISRIANIWWLVLPEFPRAGPFWVDVAAMLALGGPMALLFAFGLRYPERLRWRQRPVWTAEHG
jgi:hypothetical protein